MSTAAEMKAKTPAQSDQFPNLVEMGLGRLLKKINWPLMVGTIITLFILTLAIFGPDWAPNDPMQENYALTINGKIVRPPYPPFTLPDYPLGTDQFGRDLLSRLLYAVRPTMILVTSVAVVRLLLGLLLGYLIGWSGGLRGKILEFMLSIALAIPVLIVALMGVSAVGIHKGLSAFIFGLAITGWAETARIVSSQIKAVKSQAFIEASQALGSSEGRIFFKHVLPQISPLVWMLMAFEISATLFVISELGFLGYYIGGGVWIEISDFVAINATGLPELGQMLSTALVSFVKPLPLILVSTFIFLMIMGFNLLGEGLRQRINHQMQYGRSRSLIANTRLEDWLEKKFHPAASDWLETNALRLGLVFAALLIVGGWTIWWRWQPIRTPAAGQQRLAVPGDHYWAAERHDAQGSRWAALSGPSTSSLAWTYLAEGGFVGGPVVSADGVVYIPTADQKLIALNASGEEVWQVELGFTPVRSPALSPDGKIYVTDTRGGLSAVSSEGILLWHFEPDAGREATSGPIVDSTGTVYYTRVDSIQAVSAEGEPIWRAFAYDGYVELPPILSAGESYVFLEDGALAASSGAKLALDGLPVEELKFTVPAFFVGANGKTYFRTGHEVYEWRATKSGIQVEPRITWEYEGQVVVPPYDQGATPEDLIWLFYSGEYFDTRFVWLDKNSTMVYNLRPTDRQSKLIAIDQASVSYICSNNFNIQVNCKAYDLNSLNPRWVLEIGDQISVVGGALAPDRLYVATDRGVLFAVGAGEGGEPGVQPAGTAGADMPATTIAAPTPQNTPTPTEAAPTPTKTASPVVAEKVPAQTPESTPVKDHLLRLPIIYK